jgi:chromosome segregation ATPase
MENLKEKISRLVMGYIQNIFSELDELESCIKEKKDTLHSLTVEADELAIKNKELRHENSDFLNNLRIEKDRLQSEKDLLNSKSAEIDVKIKVADKALNAIKESRDVLAKEIESLQEQKNGFGKFIEERDNLMSELNSLGKQIEYKLNEIKQANLAVEQVEKEKKAEIDKLEEEIKKLQKERDDAVKNILPKINELNERERILREREDAMNVVIERYKRLYGEKGAGFKV